MARKPKPTKLSERVEIGKPSPAPAEAWWYLRKGAKDLLKQERARGLYGGFPGMAKYWLVQERGEPKAAVKKPLHYIRDALAEWEPNVHGKVTSWLRE